VTITDQQYSEEVQLVAGVIRGLGRSDHQLRDDKPGLRARLDELKGDAETLNATLARIKDEAALVTAQLLSDDELKRLAQLARDIRDDNLPDVDAEVPITRCPDWCEVETHAGTREGRLTHHEGAMSSWHVQGYTGETVTLGVYLEEDGTPKCNLQSNAALRSEDIVRLRAELDAANQLVIRIEAGR
jgi:hypothetical protein